MSTVRIAVNLGGGAGYDVRIGKSLFEGLGKKLSEAKAADTALVVTDTNVGPLYLGPVKESLAAAGFRVVDIVIPAGEASKSVKCAAEIWEAMAETRLTRDSLVVALGGGVVGDIAGFVASTYMRGIEVAQAPTTLLAMVDSSVGGKTGINLEAGKNLVGSFKQPIHVCASIDTLATLDDREWACGCAEVAKMAAVDSDEFFFWLEEHTGPLAAREEAVVAEAVSRCVVAKANVVALDATESKGVRECLNYGHTMGHAIEALAGYGTFSHGHAVAEGMRFAARLGEALIQTSGDFVAAQDALLDALGLPALDWSAEPQAIFDAMKGDKKVRGGRIRFVLLRDVGAWEVVDVDEPTLHEHLAAWARSKGRGRAAEGE